MLVALDLALGKPMEIVLAGPRSDGFKAMLAASSGGDSCLVP